MSLALASGSRCWIPTIPNCKHCCSSSVAPVGVRTACVISCTYSRSDVGTKRRHIYVNGHRSQFPSSSNYMASTSSSTSPLQGKLLVSATEYKFPDPIPEFAHAEKVKFKAHLLQKLSKKKDIYGDSLHQVVDICTEIFNNFLQTEYGGPGTLLVIPFIDMNDAINERGLPGGPKAAEAAVKWARKHVDSDWKEWTSVNANSS